MLRERLRCAAILVASVGGLLVAAGAVHSTHDDQDPPMPYPGDIDPAWSPDGKEIVFASNRNPHDRQEHGFTLYVVDLESERIRPLTPWKYGGAKPAWSPDGKYVAFNSTSSGHIGMVEVASGEVTWLTSGERHGFDPSWAPDSQHVAFTAIRSSRDQDLFVLDITKSLRSVEGQRRVIRLAGTDRTPAWSPDGKLIAFQHQAKERSLDLPSGAVDIMTVQPDGQDLRTVFTVYGDVYALSWRTDSRRLLVTTEYVPADDCLHYEVDVETRAGRPVRYPVPPASPYGAAVAVSPDDTRLVYSYDALDRQDCAVYIWVSDLDGTNAREVTHRPEWYYQRFGEPEPIEGEKYIYGVPAPKDPQRQAIGATALVALAVAVLLALRRRRGGLARDRAQS